jgi:hypothetical protein
VRSTYGLIVAGFCRPLGVVLVLWCASGCVSRPGPAGWQAIPVAASQEPAFATAQQTVSEAFPSAYRATQRAIITVRQRQFVCDGFLTVSPSDGRHLALVSTLGLVTDVRVKADGSSQVVRVTPLFRESWAREYVCRELRCLFTPPSGLVPAGRLTDGRLLLEAESFADGVKARYACSRDGSRWEELEVFHGLHRLVHVRVCSYRSFPGWPRAVPAEFEVKAGTHELHIQIAALSTDSALPREEVR